VSCKPCERSKSKLVWVCNSSGMSDYYTSSSDVIPALSCGSVSTKVMYAAGYRLSRTHIY